MQIKNSDMFFLVLILLLGGVSVYSLMTYKYNEELQNTITEKDKVLNDLLLKDSLHNEAQRKYSENITRYVEECSYIVDGKKVNSDGIIQIIQKLYNERSQKSDSLKYFVERRKVDDKYFNFFTKNYPKIRDSLAITKTVIETIEKKYSTKVTARIEGEKMIISTPINKLDSALAVYKYYKHKLKVKGNAFTVEIDKDNPNKD